MTREIAGEAVMAIASGKLISTDNENPSKTVVSVAPMCPSRLAIPNSARPRHIAEGAGKMYPGMDRA